MSHGFSRTHAPSVGYSYFSDLSASNPLGLPEVRDGDSLVASPLPVDRFEHHPGFVPDYLLRRIEARNLDSDIQAGVKAAREDMRLVQQAKNPQFARAKELYEQLASGERTMSSLKISEWTLLAKFSDLLKRLYDWIFGKPKAPQEPQQQSNRARFVYDAQGTKVLRKVTARTEGQAISGDKDVDSAYDSAGVLRKFLKDIVGMDSIDGKGMPIHQTVHYGQRYANAFWNGREMAYGDGDGLVFGSFAQDSTVIHHELGHGIIEFQNREGGLIYQGESGALNESFADITAISLQHYVRGVDVLRASRGDWLIGAKAMLPYVDKSGQKVFPSLRSFLAEKSFENHPVIGTDEQPKHMRDKYTGEEDGGGVHINSGIANHAFYLASHAVGGKIWETTYQVWLEALRVVPANCTFEQFALATVEAAKRLASKPGSKIGRDAAEKISASWAQVGVLKTVDSPTWDDLLVEGQLDDSSPQVA